MNPQSEYAVNPGWGLLMSDAGISVANVLRRAGLPRDLFTSGQKSISTDQMFALWEAMEAEADDPLLPLTVGQAMSIETFDAPLFAATCSPNLNVAARRLAQHKKLIGPMRLSIVQSDAETVLEFLWPQGAKPPGSVSIGEPVFWVALVRLCTRHLVRPIRVTSPKPPADRDAYLEYFGVPVAKAFSYTVAFSAHDAVRPFLTANDAMWDFFEPELRRRLSDLEEATTTGDRVRAALLEMLPAGDASMAGVARELAMSTRTLQRRLREEGATFQAILDDTREALARHYLSASDLSTGEISFLLGYEDTRSFYRAFRSWTGQTPQLVRAAAG